MNEQNLLQKKTRNQEHQKMERFGKVIHESFEKIRKYSLQWVSGEKSSVHDVLADDSFIRDIIYSINHLDRIDLLTIEEKIEHIRRIGIVSWTGGPQALTNAGAQVERFINLYRVEETMDVKIEIMKTLSLICCLNKSYQNQLRESGFLDEMLNTLAVHNPKIIDLQKWIIYTLNTVTSNNTENQRHVLAFPNLKDTLCAYQTESWFSWRKNEATHIIKALCFGK